MSLRAACRLQTLGFTRIYYVLGKADRLAHELSTVGTQANVPAKGPALRGCGHGSAG